ncbi:hypothetical protein BDN70DRAFT_397832 [Pholiota conissans]|uniref:Uncharacterized protein n=1 Tax=Pholiota conissans TaxID=109636 RepID=A0A9P5YQK5_9AGAR|nr:hypothetical protein BDN70DRAFT_397832 [Pholiota conissans]
MTNQNSTLSSFDLCRIGKDEAERQNFLNELNELRCIVRRPPFSPIVYKENSHTEQFFSLISTSDSAFDLDTRPQAPDRKLPFELERQIFELCAIENPWLCTTLVQVAKRVNEWIDAILIETVVFVRPPFSDSSQTSRRQELFLSKLTAGKPAEYYARHVKNLAIIGSFGLEAEVSVINQILAICSGVENLVLAVSNSKGRFDFLAGPQALPNLRRLTITLRTFTIRPVVGQPGSWTKPNFHHYCFSSLTHLHVADKDTSYATFTGWENLTSLTHLELSSPDGQDQTILLLQKLPIVRYIAIGSYFTTRESRYAAATLFCLQSFTGVWSDRVVYLSEIPGHDWERGAWGEGDFWDIVEREVERRLAQKSRG